MSHYRPHVEHVFDLGTAAFEHASTLFPPAQLTGENVGALVCHAVLYFSKLDLGVSHINSVFGRAAEGSEQAFDALHFEKLEWDWADQDCGKGGDKSVKTSDIAKKCYSIFNNSLGDLDFCVN